MKYHVHAVTLDTYNSQNIERDEVFDTYNDALDYYRDTFKNQSELIADYGGQHVIMLYSKGDNHLSVLKRQTIQTTTNNIVNND